MPTPPITRIVLDKHGIDYFEREGPGEWDATLTHTFQQAEVSDVLKALIVLDLDGGHVASVSYDLTQRNGRRDVAKGEEKPIRTRRVHSADLPVKTPRRGG